MATYSALMEPTFFINHGGGPCFFLECGRIRDGFRELEAYLSGFNGRLSSAPKAVLVTSGHWQEAVPTVNAAEDPPQLHDYGRTDPAAEAFDDWPRNQMLRADARDDALIHWTKAPSGRSRRRAQPYRLPRAGPLQAHLRFPLRT